VEDCRRAAILITPLKAPEGCAAEILIDRPFLQQSGAITLRLDRAEPLLQTARAPDEDRPWSPAPPRHWTANPLKGTGREWWQPVRPRPEAVRDQQQDSEETEDGMPDQETDDAEPLD